MNIKIPEGMLKAVIAALAEHWKERTLADGSTVDVALEAALRWLVENPPTLPLSDAAYIARNTYVVNETSIIAIVKSGIERMFLAPEPEYIGSEELGRFCARYQRIDEAVIEAYRRGKESK